MHTRTLCILLVLQAVVSFRAVPRIMELFRDRGYVKLEWVPHFSSVINWTLRLGLAALRQVKPVDSPWLAIMDHSIERGVNKVLVVLRVPLEALAERGSAIRLADCECIGLEISECTDGETVASALKAIFTRAGSPVAIVKDNGADLDKGVRLWQAWAGKRGVWLIEDIGHVMANALKGQYEKHAQFVRFVKLIHQGAARLRQTNLAFLLPPKLRTKARFQGISRLGAWAENMLQVLGGRGRAEERSALAKLRTAMAGFGALRPFIERFARSVQGVAQVLEVLKNKGLNQQNYHQCCQLAEQLPACSKVKKRLLVWLKHHLYIQCRLGIGQRPLLVSSDIIESLFGSFKHIIARAPQGEINRTALVIPALCGHLDQAVIAQALAHTTHRDLQHWEQQQVPVTLRKQRRAFLQINGDQKPGIQIPLKVP